MTASIYSARARDFARVRFIMTKPSLPANVGAAARAMKTMGFGELVLVAPKVPQVTHHPEAHALASGATDVLQAAHSVATLEEALAPVTLALALTARSRELGPPVCDIRQAAQLACTHLRAHADARVAVVLGTERTGLSNAHIALCQRVCLIPANPDYSSLNVAQALQLAAWELRYALCDGVDSAPPATKPGSQPASQAAVHALIEHLHSALVAVRFLDPQHPKKLMPRLQHVFAKSNLTRDEVALLRGICSAMVQTAARAAKTAKISA